MARLSFLRRRLAFFLRRIAARIVRRLHGENRTPVREWTEADLRALEHGYGVLMGTAAGAIVALDLLLITWRPM
ncbi:hypothetical protein [Paraburkholderia caribensis]|uniref:hypothetical protein n=1 Tax=Paraburkholderia caribensis TaxID=75105 RepID=UPI001CC4EBF3|nr:hypothetical protein [Paraburkholderia caribensis]